MALHFHHKQGIIRNFLKTQPFFQGLLWCPGCWCQREQWDLAQAQMLFSPVCPGQVFFALDSRWLAWSLVIQTGDNEKLHVLAQKDNLLVPDDQTALYSSPQGRSRPKVPTHRFFLNLPQRKVMIYYWQKGKKNWGSPTSFWREHAPKNTLNLKIRASLADKATVSVSPKILQLDLWIEMFSAKYSLSGPIKWI